MEHELNKKIGLNAIKYKIKNKIFNRDIRDSIPVRAILFPIGFINKARINRQYLLSSYPQRIRKYKNIHAGKRCFIIGNGPSLTPSDLDLIKDEYSFAANKIFSIYDRTIWRPSYYLCMDTVSVAEEIGEEIEKLETRDVFFNWTNHSLIGDNRGVNYALFNPEYIINMFNFKKCYISEECDRRFGNALTVTFSSIQLAIYMGFKEIYLLGVDFSYPYYKDKIGRKHCTNVEESHFSGGDYKKDNNICYLLKYTNENGFRNARIFCEKHGIIIKNLTRGGKLEVFERDTLENIMKK